MIPARLFLLALAAAAATPGMAAGAEQNCLSQEQRRAAIATHRAVPLTRAMRIVKARIAGDVVNALLCQREKGLVYVLTVLTRDGKVTRATVNAADGHWLDGS